MRAVLRREEPFNFAKCPVQVLVGLFGGVHETLCCFSRRSWSLTRRSRSIHVLRHGNRNSN
jgi:hypothetical protein